MVQSPASSSRRAARETALRALYTLSVGRSPAGDDVIEETIVAQSLEPEAAAFARSLIDSVQRALSELDHEIARHAIGYPPERQTVVDRTILRIATSEVLTGVSGAPYGVIANEAVELAKKYSTPEAAKFINGVLGALIRTAGAEAEAPPADDPPSPIEEAAHV
jgi:N utilization substance protein B